MRKKGHKKINPNDASIDHFYVVNYQEFGKKWGALVRESMFEDDDDTNGFNLSTNSQIGDDDDDDEADMEEWCADPERVTCLFCSAAYFELNDLLTHMTSIHDFDFQVRAYYLCKANNCLKKCCNCVSLGP